MPSLSSFFPFSTSTTNDVRQEKNVAKAQENNNFAQQCSTLLLMAEILINNDSAMTPTRRWMDVEEAALGDGKNWQFQKKATTILEVSVF